MTVRSTYDLSKAAEIVSTLDPKRRWVIEITETRAKRTNEQNKLLWAIYTAIANATGHTTEEIHEACKAMFLPPHTVKLGEREVTVSGSTVTDKMSFSDYVEKVQAWASNELGVQP
jgi:methyl coenzyme M reductase subunit D